ncbi:MAG: hypothetical protein ACP5KN_19695 [Armatimonadota bacterium]
MDREVVAWLKQWPPTRYLVLRDLEGRPADDPELLQARAAIPEAEHVRDLLRGQRGDGGFVGDAYSKWRGAHWRMVTLTHLGLPADNDVGRRATEYVLDRWTGEGHRRPGSIRRINGRWRRCASQEGNALGVACSMGMADDPRARLLADSLVEWQWPDGGWNCDKRPEAHHSSFHESFTPMWGLLLYTDATGDEQKRSAARRTAELLLEHRLFRSSTDGSLIHEEWTKLHWPWYWHYDVLAGLDVLRLVDGALEDPRAQEALDLVEQQRREDGRWRHTGRRYWRPPTASGRSLEVTNWGDRREPSRPLTLIAMRVLKAAGRLQL